MLPDDRTRPVGVQGLMRLKLEEGDTDTAMALAKKAFALRPDNERVLRTLFDLQSKKEDWAGARETLNASMHARLLPRDVGTRRDAVLSLADARAALAAGNTARGNEAALQANRLAPTLIPAAALAARVQAGKGPKRKATQDPDRRLGGEPAPRARRRLRGDRARRDPGGPAQALRDADRGRARRTWRAGCSRPSSRSPPRISPAPARRSATSPRPSRRRAAWR